jgi:hypothetical protein
MPGPSRLDEHYGADPRGRIKPSRGGRAWWVVGLACLVGLAIAGYRLRDDGWELYDEILGLPAREATFEGRVLDGNTGVGVPNAQVEVTSWRTAFLRAGRRGERLTGMAMTSASGAYRIHTRWARVPHLHVDAVGYESAGLDADPRRPQEIRLVVVAPMRR